MDKILAFTVICNGNIIGINLKARSFLVGDNVLPFFSSSEKLKLVYFMTRTVTTTVSEEDLNELSKVFTVGYEDEEGKVFLNMVEENGQCFLSNQNPSIY